MIEHLIMDIGAIEFHEVIETSELALVVVDDSEDFTVFDIDVGHL